ncbi:MAG: hypothetical protein AB1430_01055 [Pseudomonadota bacterium]
MLALLLCCALPALAQPAPMSDEELASVEGRDGIGLAVHLELDSSLSAGFSVNGTTTYAVVQGLGGTADLVALTLDVRRRSDGGGDYVDIGLPGFVGFKQFGFRALGAQTDPLAPIAPGAGYGQVLLDGTASMTGHLYLWAN